LTPCNTSSFFTWLVQMICCIFSCTKLKTFTATHIGEYVLWTCFENVRNLSY
jgi:hypothetical protein